MAAMKRKPMAGCLCWYQWLCVGAVVLALLASGCATGGDVKKLAATNEVQNRRISAVESSSSEQFAKVREEEQETRKTLRAAEGRLLVLTQKVDSLLAEQRALSEALEKLIAQNRALRRRQSDQQKAAATTQLEHKSDIDSVRLQLGEVEKLMKTSFAHLPSKTKADKQFREAFSLLVGGQLDLAADRFEEFSATRPKDKRTPEAKYRAGQALFLLRKYDHALVPFFELVDKHGKHKLAVEARWMLARTLEETGDLKLARDFYAALIVENTVYKADATRRVFFINQLYPSLQNSRGGGRGAAKRP